MRSPPGTSTVCCVITAHAEQGRSATALDLAFSALASSPGDPRLHLGDRRTAPGTGWRRRAVERWRAARLVEVTGDEAGREEVATSNAAYASRRSSRIGAVTRGALGPRCRSCSSRSSDRCRCPRCSTSGSRHSSSTGCSASSAARRRCAWSSASRSRCSCTASPRSWAPLARAGPRKRRGRGAVRARRRSSPSCAARSTGSAVSVRSPWLHTGAELRAIEKVSDEVASAAAGLSRDGYGALIVIERETGLEQIAETGVMIHGDASADLLRTIFARGTSLHDGAVIIREDRVLAAGALLPLAETTIHTERYGTRHRAAQHHRVDRRDRRRRVRGERPDQPRRAGPDRAQPERAPARPRDPRATRRTPPVAASSAVPGPWWASATPRRARALRGSRFVRGPGSRGRIGSRRGRTGAAVRRILAIVLHNWPLKLAAVGLATVLYGGIVLSEGAETFNDPVPIRQPVIPPGMYLLGRLVLRASPIRPQRGRPAATDTFRATIDLSGITQGGTYDVPSRSLRLIRRSKSSRSRPTS